MMSYCMFCHTGTEDTSSYQLFWKQLKPPQTAWPLILEIALHFHWTPLDVFFFFFFSTELYVVSWPRYRKWKVPWMHRLDSLLRNDNSEAGGSQWPFPPALFTGNTRQKCMWFFSMCVCYYRCKHVQKHSLVHLLYMNTMNHTMLGKKYEYLMSYVLCSLIYDLWLPVK